MIPELEEIQRLLWGEWDPLGVNAPGWPNDEYDSYAFRIFTMMNSGAAANDIDEYLHRAATDHIGLNVTGNEGEIARKVIAIHTLANPATRSP